MIDRLYEGSGDPRRLRLRFSIKILRPDEGNILIVQMVKIIHKVFKRNVGIIGIIYR